jgi:hypothetical protein
MNRSLPERLRSAALLVPVLGLFLLLPPFVTLFTGEPRLLGIPLIVLYLFGVWAALIVGAALLAHRLEDRVEDRPEDRLGDRLEDRAAAGKPAGDDSAAARPAE